MSKPRKKRRNFDREGMEIYLLNLLLAYQPIFLILGLFLFIYSIVALPHSVTVGAIAMTVALILAFLGYSYPMTVYLAKVGAWLGSLQKKDRDL